jgi:F0F1-type ATP synthase assembly protein I
MSSEHEGYALGKSIHGHGTGHLFLCYSLRSTAFGLTNYGPARQKSCNSIPNRFDKYVTGRKTMPQQSQPGLMRYASAGVEFIATFGLVMGAGWWLDRRFDKSPLFTLIGAALGFAGATWRLVRQARAIGKEMQDRRTAGKQEPK